MRRVKLILSLVGQNLFWIVTALVIGAALGGWYFVTNSLNAAYLQHSAKIDQRFRAIETMKAVKRPPNQSWRAELSKINDAERESLAEAWDRLYANQESVLRWPEELGSDFIAFVESNPSDAELRPDFRHRYFRLITEEFERTLLTMVNAEPNFTPKSALDTPFGTPREAASSTAHTYRVQWDGKSQAAVHKLWNWETVPSSDEVRRAQEDYWVATSILQLIHDMNDGVYLQRVGEISEFEIGAAAAEKLERLLKQNTPKTPPPAPGGSKGLQRAPKGAPKDIWGNPVASPNSAAPLIKPTGMVRERTHSDAADIWGSAVPGSPSPLLPASLPPNFPSLPANGENKGSGDIWGNAPHPFGAPAGPKTGSPEPKNPADSRYVTADGKRMTAAEASTSPFKCIPVHLVITLDQREINRFLVECANCTLPIETKSVRILSAKKQSSKNSVAVAAQDVGPNIFGASIDFATKANPQLRAENVRNDIGLELFSVVYIYNRPPQTDEDARLAGTASAK